MGLGAGEILHGGSTRIGRKQANIHLHPAAKTEAHFVLTASNNFHQDWKIDDMLDQFIAVLVNAARGSGYQDVEIANGFASATKRAGGRDFLNPGIVAKMVHNFSGLSFGSVQKKPSGNAAIVLD